MCSYGSRLAWCLFPVLMLATSGYRYALAERPGNATGQIEITLLPSCNAVDDVVLMSHIAHVSAANESLREKIKALDLADAPRPNETTEITTKLIEFRLRLAGIDPRRVSIRGTKTEVRNLVTTRPAFAELIPVEPTRMSKVNAVAHTSTQRGALRDAYPVVDRQAVVEQGADKIEDVIFKTARRAVLDQLPWGEEFVTVKLLQPVKRSAKWLETATEAKCTAQIRTSGAPVGKVSVDVTVTSANQSPVVVPVSLEVRHFETVVATARPIARGRTIQSEDLYLQRWDVTGGADYCTKAEQMIGRIAARSLPALQIVRDQDLEQGSARTSETGPVVIKARTRVKLTAKIGDLKIIAEGEALQDGRIGESIRVQNVESKKIVQARVLSAEEVEISY